MTTLSGSNLPLLKVLASPFVSLRQALTVCDDCWTWNTINGDVYEDVVLLELNHDSVTIQHKYGFETIARADLDHETQHYLRETANADTYGESENHFAHSHETLRHAA